jgi:ankyrin repeat protein
LLLMDYQCNQGSLVYKKDSTKVMAWWCSLVLLLSIAGHSYADNYQNPAYAAKAQDWIAMQTLIRQGASLNSALADKSTALSWAVHWNEIQTIESLLQLGADPNLANDFGITSLYLACENRSFPVIDSLLQAGANPNAATWAGETVLMTCARTGNDDGVNALITYGADINTREPERGQTALMWAAAEKHSAVVESLIEIGADITVRSRKVTLPPQILSPTYSEYSFFPKSKGDFSSLMFAAQSGDLRSVQALLTGGADVNESTPEYGSALVLAAVNGHYEVALYLLEMGADPNMTDGYGIAPIHWAIQEGISFLYGQPHRTDRFWLMPNSKRLVQALLGKGVDPNMRMERDIPPYDFHRYARTTNNDIPQVRLGGATPILLAAASGDIEIYNMLLDAKADPLLAAYDTKKYIASSGPGLTPLMVAAGVGRERKRTPDRSENYFKIVKHLIELGADVNQVGPGGRIALHGAIYMQDKNIIRYLAEHGANVDAKDWYDQSPISMVSGDPGGFSQRRGPGNTADNSMREEFPILEDVIELLYEFGASPYDGPVADLSGH